MSKNEQEFASVLIDGLWRACPRPGIQWDLREMGISSGFGLRGQANAIKLSDRSNALRAARSMKNNVNNDKTASGPIMGVLLLDSCANERKRSRMSLLCLINFGGDEIDILEDGRTQASIPVFMLNAVRAWSAQNDTTVYDGLTRLLAAGLESSGPQVHDHCLMVALECRGGEE